MFFALSRRRCTSNQEGCFAVRTLSRFLVLLAAASITQVRSRLLAPASRSERVLSATGTYLTQKHLQSIASFDPDSPPERRSHGLSSSTARDLQTPPSENAKCRPLQISEWLRLLQTETNAEFDITEEIAEAADADPTLLLARAQLMWQDTTDFEWDRALAATRQSSLPAPFVVCMEQPRSRSSGFRRRKFVRDRIRDAISDMDGDEVWRQVILRTIHNGDDMFCVYSLMDAVVAQNIDFEGCAVQPMTMSMKLMPRTVQLLLDKAKECKDQIDSKTKSNSQRQRREQDTVLDLLLSENDGDGDSGRDEEWNDDDNIELDCDALELARPAADVLFCPGSLTYNQISALQAGDPSYIVAALTSKKGNQVSGIAEQVYWTSTEAEPYRRTESARAEFWREALEEAGSERCDNVIETKLQWSVRHSDDGDFSVLRVVYDASTAKQWESGCVGSLIAGLAVRQDVCGLEIAADIGVKSYNANWLVQSGVQDETPWTDVGLDGEGQVVALSDTGIDVNNCEFIYFNMRIIFGLKYDLLLCHDSRDSSASLVLPFPNK